MTAARGAWERRTEHRIERALLTLVTVAFMARRRLVLARGWVDDRRGGTR